MATDSADCCIGAVRAAAAAASDAGPLLVVEFGSGVLARTLLEDPIPGHPLELIVVGATAELPAGAVRWSASVSRPGHFFHMQQALLRQGRRTALLVPGGCAAQLALRHVQLFAALKTAVLLVLCAAEAPSAAASEHRHAVFCASPPCQLTLGQLPKKPEAERRARWASFLAASLALVEGAAVSLDGDRVVARRESPLALLSPPPDASCTSTAGRDAAFPPVVLSVVQQLKVLRAEVDASLSRLPPAWLRPRADCGEPGDGSAAAVRVELVPSTAARYAEGGYSQHHYVPELPSAHAAAYELRLVPADDGDADADADADTRVGYISILAEGSQEPTRLFPTAVAHRELCAAQVERLVVLPPWRGRGAKEVLLRACGGFARSGYPVRVKTRSEAVQAVFMRCSLLAYEGHRAAGTTRCGVHAGGRRPMVRYARALPEVMPEEARGKSPSAGGRAADEAGEAGDGRAGSRVKAPEASARPSVAASWRRNSADEAKVGGGDGDRVASATPAGGVPRRQPPLGRSARALINKLTPETFERLMPPLIEAVVEGVEPMADTLWLLLSRAAREPIFAAMYADAAARLAPPANAEAAAAARLALDRVLAVDSPCHAPTQPSLEARPGVGPEAVGFLLAELVRVQLLHPSELLGSAEAPGLLEGTADTAEGRLSLCACTARVGSVLRLRDPSTLRLLVDRVRSLGVPPAASAWGVLCAEVLESERRGWPVNEPGARSAKSAKSAQTLGEVRSAAAMELGLVLVPKNAPPERMRGLREGWVFWYVGAPVLHPDTAQGFTFDQTAGRWRQCPPVAVPAA